MKTTEETDLPEDNIEDEFWWLVRCGSWSMKFQWVVCWTKILHRSWGRADLMEGILEYCIFKWWCQGFPSIHYVCSAMHVTFHDFTKLTFSQFMTIKPFLFNPTILNYLEDVTSFPPLSKMNLILLLYLFKHWRYEIFCVFCCCRYLTFWKFLRSQEPRSLDLKFKAYVLLMKYLSFWDLIIYELPVEAFPLVPCQNFRIYWMDLSKLIYNFAAKGVTKIKYLTDGVLLREMMEDPLLMKYRYNVSEYA